MRKSSWISLSIMICLTLLKSAGCAPAQGSTVLPAGQNSLQAALTASTLTPVTPTSTVPAPSQCDIAQFIADVTVPAGTVMVPGVTFTKTWRLMNVGTCTWTTSYQLVFYRGEQMGASPSAAFSKNIAPGEMADFSMEMTVPLETGSHIGYWMFKNASGSWFGISSLSSQSFSANVPLSVEINVVGETPTPTPTDTATNTPTPTPTATPTYTPTPTPDLIDEQAVALAKELAPQFTRTFGVQFDPALAKGLDAARIGGQAGQVAGMIAPVIDGNQKYTDRKYQVRDVEGLFSLNDNRLTLETMIIINKGTIQYPLLPLGPFMIACDPQRVNDCLAISLGGEEFQIMPEIIYQTELQDQASPPQVAYEEGSIRQCFKVLKRKICIRVFK